MGRRLRGLARRANAMRHELAKFGAVGLTAYTVDSIALVIFRAIVHEPTIAKTLATVISTTVAFLGNRYWTWRDLPRSGLTRESTLFAVINVVGLGIQVGCLDLSHYGLGSIWPGPFHSLLADFASANLVGMVFATSFRFWAYRTYVFHAPTGAPTPEPPTSFPATQSSH